MLRHFTSATLAVTPAFPVHVLIVHDEIIFPKERLCKFLLNILCTMVLFKIRCVLRVLVTISKTKFQRMASYPFIFGLLQYHANVADLDHVVTIKHF